ARLQSDVTALDEAQLQGLAEQGLVIDHENPGALLPGARARPDLGWIHQHKLPLLGGMGASAPCLDTPGSGVDSTPKPVTLTGLEAEHGGTSRRIIGGWKCAAFLGILPRRWPGPPRRHPGLPREEA